MPEYAEAQALAAHVYGLSEDDLRHILGTFPLIPADVKCRTIHAFVTLSHK